MLHDQHFAFVDESGNHDLETEKQGASTHFVVAAVIAQEEHLDELRQQVHEVRQRHFGPGEIKSSGIGGKVKRRRRIAEALAELDFALYVVSVDKREIFEDSGLRFKKSFLKFINGLLYRQLYQAFPRLSVVADEHGSREFMDGFKSYVERKHYDQLFLDADFRFVPSESEVLVQLADFFAGTIFRCVQDGAKQEERDLLKLFAEQIITIDDWPPRFEYYGDPLVDSSTPDEDRLVRDTAIRSARTFIADHVDEADENPLVALQVDCLQYLLFRFRYDSPEVHVPLQELQNHLGRRRRDGVTLSEQIVRLGVIGKLKDHGVLITSSTQGYKLPASMTDLHEFVEMSRRNIEPQLDRIAQFRKRLRLASSNEIDILAHPNYERLRRFVENDGAT